MTAVWAPVGVGVVAFLVAAVRRTFLVVTVRGPSMEPTLCDGDRVLVRRGRVRSAGRVVVLAGGPGGVADPESLGRAVRAAGARRRDWMIKRVAAVAGDPVPRRRVPSLADAAGHRVPSGSVVVLGDNATASHDSRALGYIPAEHVWGVVVGPVRRSDSSSRKGCAE